MDQGGTENGGETESSIGGDHCADCGFLKESLEGSLRCECLEKSSSDGPCMLSTSSFYTRRGDVRHG